MYFSTGGCCERVKWLLSWPLSCLLYYTVPNCLLPHWERWFMVTFVVSTLWIAVFSYLMVWMVCNILHDKWNHLMYKTVPTLNVSFIPPSFSKMLCSPVFCVLGHHHQFHTGHPRCDYGHHVFSSWHKRPWLHG